MIFSILIQFRTSIVTTILGSSFFAVALCTEPISTRPTPLIQPVSVDPISQRLAINPELDLHVSPAETMGPTDPAVLSNPLQVTPNEKAVEHSLRGAETPSGPQCGRYNMDSCVRSGCPDCVGRFAKLGVTADHSVGYVGGGGSFLLGGPRTPSEGTFGLDYRGHWFSRHVWLLWNHGRKHQGGAGAYASDGPKIIPE